MLRTLAKVWGGVLGVVWILFVACGDIADFDRFLSLQRGEKCGVHPLSLLVEDASFSPLATSCISPPAASSPATTLFVSEYTNKRVLVFNIEAITNGENAINVLGQANFTSSDSAITQTGLSGPSHLQSTHVGQYLFVSDNTDGVGSEPNRTMIWDVTTISDGENASNVLGPSNFTSSGSATVTGVDLDSTNNRLFVGETTPLVRVYDVSTITDGESSTNTLCSGSGTTQSTCQDVRDTAYDSSNQRLFVSDLLNNRILVFDVTAISDGENAVNVLGQANFTSGTENRGGSAGQNTLNQPYGLAYASPYLYISDYSNNRVVIYDVSSITDGENAAYVLGQPNFTTTSADTTIAKMNGPLDVSVDTVSNKLFVADYTNNRVLVFDISTITNGEDAANVLGQSGFTSADAATTQSGMTGPLGVALK